MSLQEFCRGNHALLPYISTDDRTADGFRCNKTLAMLVDVEKHTLDAARVVHYTTVPGRAAYRSSVFTPLTPHKRQLL